MTVPASLTGGRAECMRDGHRRRRHGVAMAQAVRCIVAEGMTALPVRGTVFLSRAPISSDPASRCMLPPLDYCHILAGSRKGGMHPRLRFRRSSHWSEFRPLPTHALHVENGCGKGCGFTIPLPGKAHARHKQRSVHVEDVALDGFTTHGAVPHATVAEMLRTRPTAALVHAGGGGGEQERCGRA